MKQYNISGPQIKLARKNLGWDQFRLSVVLEDEYDLSLSQSDISEIERQLRGVKDFELLAFSESLDVSINWLLKKGGEYEE